VNSNGVFFEQKTSFPGEDVMNHFEFKTMCKHSPDVSFSKGSYQIYGLISGLLFNSMYDGCTPPILIKDTPNNRQLIFSYLAAFNQVSPITLNQNYRKNTNYLSFISGHPLVCISTNQKVLDSLKKPIFVLHDHGFDLGELNDSLESISLFSDWFFPEFIEKLITVSDMVKKPERLSEIIETGCGLMSRLMKVDIPDGDGISIGDDAGDVIVFSQEEETGTENINTGKTSTSNPST
jgi:hypothetical protein